MKIITVKKIYFVLIAILLFFIGSRFYMEFLNYIIPNNENAKIVSTRLSSQFFESIYFGLSLAMIPILIMLSWKFVTNKKMSSIFIIGFSFLGYLVNYTLLKSSISYQSNQFSQSFYFEEINYSAFIFLGCLIGFFLSIIIFKKSKPQS